MVQPSTTPFPPYSSFGFRTSWVRRAMTKSPRSTTLPAYVVCPSRTLPVHDRDGRRGLRARAMSAQHRGELASPCGDDLAREFGPEFFHHRQRGEHLRELVVVGHPGR